MVPLRHGGRNALIEILGSGAKTPGPCELAARGVVVTFRTESICRCEGVAEP